MPNNQFIDTFKEEALELLGTLESRLLELEENPADAELVSAVFRVMHTIKGSAAMFGLERIATFAHDVESILSALREGKIPVTKELVGNTLMARDMILEMLDSPKDATGPMSPEMAEFLDAFRLSVGFMAEAPGPSGKAAVAKGPEGKAADDKAAKPAPKAEPRTWHIAFTPSKDCFRTGGNPLSILNELKSLGEAVFIPSFSSVPSLADLNPEDCLTRWDIYLTTGADENQIRDVFIFVEGSAEIKLECLGDLVSDVDGPNKKLGDILVERGTITRDRLDMVLKNQRRIGEMLVQENLVTKMDLRAALEEQRQLQRAQKNKVAASDMSTIRVKSEKLDLLMSLVGELVTIHARIQQAVKGDQGSDETSAIVEQFGRLTDELRNNTMSIRMVPIGTTFSSFKRLVRDLSGELGKNVELETEGGETELDKTVIEKLNDPLVHIIRNSLDHGIERPDVRASRGKGATGVIKLSASQTGASVNIRIEDDGNGLNVEAIRAKAIAKGLIKPEDVLTDKDVYRLIFAPGFSTKEVVTEVSGRGVGMDVVNRQMELINGTVEVESEPGVFTRITLKIPLTLAIIDGLLVHIGQESFVVPLAVVIGCLEFRRAEATNDHDIVIFHDSQLPYINMREFFAIPGERPAIEQIVVVAIKDMHVGLLVDQVVGSNQTVIKPLGKLYRRAAGIASASILGDGSVALILDAEQVLHARELEGRLG